MRLLRSSFSLLAFSLVLRGQDPTAAELPSLSVSVDPTARLSLDEKEIGLLQSGSTLHVATAPGEHVIGAQLESGGPPWRKTLIVTSALPNSVNIPLRTHVQRAEMQKSGFWNDSQTGLSWAAADSGSGVTVSQARTYCQQLAVGGFHDWRLPAIDELQTIFGGEADERGFRVIAPLKLSGWAWSGTEGNEPAENWALDLGDGARASVTAGEAGLNRALCVRAAMPAARATLRAPAGPPATGHDRTPH